MHQAIPLPVPRPAAPGAPDLADCGLFIHLGSVQAPGRLDLALQALDRILRCWHASVRLLVAVDGAGRPPPNPPPPHCDFLAARRLRHRLNRGDATVLTPAFSDPQGDIVLHAIASGIPLGALNLAPMADAGAAAHLPGHAFLAVARATPRSH